MADVWKENILEDLEGRLLESEIVGEFLVDIRKKFGGGDKESVKVAELKRLEQEGKMMEESVQEFRRAARKSGYEGRLLVEEFKRGINTIKCQRLLELEQSPSSIKQWYDRTITLDRNWRESRREEERLKRQQALRQNNREAQQQQLPWPQVWPRRQEVLQQQVQVGPVLIEGVERTNTLMMHSNQRAGFAQCNLYAMDVNQENRNCYSCGGFGYLARNCRNRRTGNKIEEGRRLEYGQGNNEQSNLNGEGNLIVFN